MSRKTCVIGVVVILAVVATLTMVLLPGIERTRENAKTVRCAANLKQLYIIMNWYETMDDGWLMPALLNNRNDRYDRWYGFVTPGPQFDDTSPPFTFPSDAPNSMVKMMDVFLHCPAVNHPAGWGPVSEGGNGKWGLDYTYNQMLGSNAAAPGAPPAFEYPFVKAKEVRRETLVATDVRDVTNLHDYVFSGVTPSLVPTSKTNTADYQAIAGTPHQYGTSGNMLFADGRICTDNINKLLGPPPEAWVVNWRVPQTGSFPF